MERCIPMVLEDGAASSNDQAVAICSSMWNEKKERQAFFQFRAINQDQRIVEGIATTSQLARDGDIIESKGIRFKLPLKVLESHNKEKPIGHVIEAKVEDDRIRVRVQIAKEGVADYVDEAWRKIKAGLLDSFSIGWRTLKGHFDKSFGGFRHTETDWYELSTVAVPADSLAVITSIRNADIGSTALGQSPVPALTVNPPGVSGTSARKASMTIKEQIIQWENKRAASQARKDAIMTKSADEARVLDQAESEEFDTLTRDLGDIDTHLGRLRDHERTLAATATPVTPEATSTPENAVKTRQGSPITVKSNAPKGIGMARYAIAMIQSKGNPFYAADLALKRWPDMPEVSQMIRTAVEAGDTTTSGWASQLVPSAVQLQGEFLELLRAATIIGRIPGLRRVPFNISIPIETASGTAQWVGEGAPKPATKLTLSSVTLRWAKAAAIVGITKELAKFSMPAAELVVRDSMVKTLVRFFDNHFVSSTAEVTNVSPAGILNGITPTATTGTTAAAFRVDMYNMLNNFTTNNVPLSGIVLLMSSTQAVALSLLVTDLGVPLFPNITREGGSVLGFPVIISEAVGTKIIALNANEILLAEDPGVQVDSSDVASVEMDTEPLQGETSPITNAVALKSAFQNNLIFIRVEQFITWKAARASAVEYINGNAYAPS